MAQQKSLYGKIIMEAVLRLETGLHIGAKSDFAPIGAVDSPFIRDAYTKEPIIPGSSLKGKLRTLLAKFYAEGYLLNKIEDDREEIKRLFGTTEQPSRLQFFDLYMTDESKKRFAGMEFDTYYGEIKFENTINRVTAEAKPRQIERVPAGTEFAFRLTYNVESVEEMEADIDLLIDAFELLHMDYLGGHGSHGYGRVSLHDFSLRAVTLKSDEKKKIELEKYLSDFKENMNFNQEE